MQYMETHLNARVASLIGYTVHRGIGRDAADVSWIHSHRQISLIEPKATDDHHTQKVTGFRCR